MEWLLTNGPALLSAFGSVVSAGTNLIHGYIKAHTGADHSILLDTVNAEIQKLESAVGIIKAVTSNASAPNASDESQNPPT